MSCQALKELLSSGRNRSPTFTTFRDEPWRSQGACLWKLIKLGHCCSSWTGAASLCGLSPGMVPKYQSCCSVVLVLRPPVSSIGSCSPRATFTPELQLSLFPEMCSQNLWSASLEAGKVWVTCFQGHTPSNLQGKSLEVRNPSFPPCQICAPEIAGLHLWNQEPHCPLSHKIKKQDKRQHVAQ